MHQNILEPSLCNKEPKTMTKMHTSFLTFTEQCIGFVMFIFFFTMKFYTMRFMSQALCLISLVREIMYAT